VEVLKCPGDKVSYSRIYLDRDAFEPPPISAYEDRGTSYGFNIQSIADLVPDPWGAPVGGEPGGNWAYYFRQLKRSTNANFLTQYVMFIEGPGGFSFRDNIQVIGNHEAFSRHSVGFLDGHADYIYMDTRNWCGPGWTMINPAWTVRRGAPRPTPYYPRATGKTCE
ncbi:MAG: hypothetical protein D6744_03755, partial [Planctomycetota bacterium]